MSQITKQILIAAVVIIVAFVGYNMFFGNNQSAGNTLVAENSTAGQFPDGQTILTLLDNLNKVNLDDAIFTTNSTFASLVDFERPIKDQVSGRPNPFLPIGMDNSSNIIAQNSTSTPGIIPKKK